MFIVRAFQQYTPVTGNGLCSTKRKGPWILLFLLFLFGLTACDFRAGPRAEDSDPPLAGYDPTEAPNILFIAIDDLNDWVGAYGHPLAVTPNLDHLASQSMRFSLAMSSTPLCNPSRTAILTGLRASTTGVYENNQNFRDLPEWTDWVTLPQYLRQYGYKTFTGGKVFHKPEGPMSDPASWDHNYHPRAGTPSPAEENRWQHGMKGEFSLDYYNQAIDWAPLDIPIEETQDWITADRAARLLQENHDAPFFLAVGIFRPHLPWYAPREFFDLYDLEDIRLPHTLENDLGDVGPIGRKFAGGQAHGVIQGHSKWKEAIRGYLASISYADACVGRILEGLEASPDRDNTIVVLWGDHGFHLGEKEHWEKYTLWERANKTTLMILVPRVTRPNSLCAQPVSLIDLHATLVELAGLPARSDIESRSLLPLILDPNTPWDYPALMTHYPNNHAVRDSRYRYIRYQDGFEELYDHAVDPHEFHNLANNPEMTSIKDGLAETFPSVNAEWPDYRRTINTH
jgi:arylsulfatase A-like enzyme